MKPDSLLVTASGKFSMLLLVFLVALLFVLVSIIKFNLHPFLSLLIGGLIMGLLTGMNLMKIADSLAKGFGGTMEGIGIIIILGVALGTLLHAIIGQFHNEGDRITFENSGL